MSQPAPNEVVAAGDGGGMPGEVTNGDARVREVANGSEQAAPENAAASRSASVEGAQPRAGVGPGEPLPDAVLELLYRQLHALAGPRGDLDDLVQAAAERAVRAWPRFQGRAALSTWTYQIAYRTFVDHLRWFGRWQHRFSFWGDVSPALRTRVEAGGTGTEAQALQRERARRLHVALDQLPPAKRAVVVLYELEQLPAAEVATIVGTNERTVRSRLRDGREQLLRLLGSDPLFDPQEGP